MAITGERDKKAQTDGIKGGIAAQRALQVDSGQQEVSITRSAVAQSQKPLGARPGPHP
jgi:hypothetical protein